MCERESVCVWWAGGCVGGEGGGAACPYLIQDLKGRPEDRGYLGYVGGVEHLAGQGRGSKSRV